MLINLTYPTRLWESKNNTLMGAEMIGIDIEVGTGNPSASGLNLRGAQSCGLCLFFTARGAIYIFGYTDVHTLYLATTRSDQFY